MMRWVLVGVLAFLLSGCASRWEHATKRSSEFYAADRDCQVSTGGASQAINPRQERVTYEGCMWEKGWHKKRTIWFFDPSAN